MNKLLSGLKHHDMKAYGEMDLKHHAFLTSALSGGDASLSNRFAPGERVIGTRCLGS
jgi:hypothetical protein